MRHTPAMSIVEDRREQHLDKPLPHSEESERAIVGIVLMDNDVMEQLVGNLEPGDFYSPMCRRVYSAMLDLFKSGQIIDPIKIGEELKRAGSFDGIGGVHVITNLSHGIPPATDVSEYVKIVKEKAVRRDMIRTCYALANDCLAEDDPTSDLIAKAQTKINSISLAGIAEGNNEGFIPLGNVIRNEVVPGLETLLRGETSKISTGFPVIDHAIGGGISTSDVMLLCGLPSSGKSALALQIGFNVAAAGQPTAFLAGEMSNKENAFRILSQVSGFQNPNSLTHISRDEHDFLVQWAKSIENIPLYLDPRTSDVQSLGARLRGLVRQKGIKLLIIDYIQLLKVERVDKRQRWERITEASQEIKRLANELDIAVISVAQFNREGAKSGKPTMHDLESSGQLEKDASLILIVDRDERNVTDVTIRIVKGRNSGTSSFSGKFYGRKVTFEFD